MTISVDLLKSEARRAPLFADLPRAAVDDILALAQTQHLPASKTLFRQGDSPDAMFLVMRGLVRMTQGAPDETQTTLRLMGPGELIGCAAVVRRFPYPASATTLERTSLLSWRADDFLDVMQRRPEIAGVLLRVIAERTREMVERVADLSGKGLERRIAGALLRLAQQAGAKLGDDIQIKTPTARFDLAALSGASYFTISRTLSDWRKRGVVRNGRQRIVIVDEKQLAQIADGRDAARI